MTDDTTTNTPWSAQDHPTPGSRPTPPVAPYPPSAGSFGPPMGAFDPQAPYGRNPAGIAYSEKSKLAPALLQILLPGLGIGRFYLGHKTVAWMQLGLTVGGAVLTLVTVVAMFATVFGSALDDPSGTDVGALTAVSVLTQLLPMLVMAGVGWSVVDGILILCDKVPDAAGRPLRP